MEPDALTLSSTSSSLLLRQPGTFYATSDFQELVQSVFFEAGSSPPETSYQAVVMVTVSDGDLVNQPAAFTTVQVNVINESPRTLLNGKVCITTYSDVSVGFKVSPHTQSLSAEVVMEDGSPTISLSTSHTIIDDSPLITKLTITLTNPQDHASIENISLSATHPLPGGISLQVSDDGLTVELSGAASTEVYSSALSEVVYSNAKIANIIENQPDFTPRSVAR